MVTMWSERVPNPRFFPALNDGTVGFAEQLVDLDPLFSMESQISLHPAVLWLAGITSGRRHGSDP